MISENLSFFLCLPLIFITCEASHACSYSLGVLEQEGFINQINIEGLSYDMSQVMSWGQIAKENWIISFFFFVWIDLINESGKSIQNHFNIEWLVKNYKN